MSTADRGKTAEAAVKKILKAIKDKNLNFDWNKNPDAYAAGGRAQPVAGDFQAFKQEKTLGWVDYSADVKGPRMIQGEPAVLQISRNFIIEVKEVKHDFRLPYGNYSEDKVARVQRRVYAGSEAVVAILHTTTGLWRLVPQAVFTVREEGKGSWDLRAYPTVDINLALREFMGIA